MTETRTEQAFEPIRTQADFDERIKSRLAREKEKWEKQTGTEDLRAQLEAKDQELADLRRDHHRENARRVLVDELARAGVTDEGRIERVMKHVDLDAIEAGEDGQPAPRAVQVQLAAVNRDMPELLTYRVGAGSRGSHRPVLEAEKPLTRQEVEAMSPAEQARPGMRARIDRFLAGERA
jgi:hypothetical protein